MGITTISAKISNVEHPQKQEVRKFMVDTGVTYTVVTYEVAKKLELKPVKTQEFVMADGTSVKRKLGYAYVEIDGDKAPSTVVIGEKGDSALIGVVTLESMGLMVDPFKRKLRPMRLMLA